MPFYEISAYMEYVLPDIEDEKYNLKIDDFNRKCLVNLLF